MRGDITLAVRGLRKVIGKREIIRGLDFELHRGQVFGFLGPNGAGKSTTIRMLVGLLRPTAGRVHVAGGGPRAARGGAAGRVHVAGRDLRADRDGALARLGCIVESPDFYGYLTGRENLEHFARMTD